MEDMTLTEVVERLRSIPSHTKIDMWTAFLMQLTDGVAGHDMHEAPTEVAKKLCSILRTNTCE